MRRLLLALTLALPAAARAEWSQYRGDSQLASSSTYAGFSKVRLLWSRDLGFVSAFPKAYRTVSLDATRLYLSADNAVWALTKSSGGVVWTSTISGAGFSQPSVAPNGSVYVSSTGHVMALSPSDGSMVAFERVTGLSGRNLETTATSAISQVNSFAPPLIGPDGTVYQLNGQELGSGSGGEHAFVALASTGTARWVRWDNETLHSAALSPSGTTLYFVSSNGTNDVYAVDTATGGIVWKVGTNNNNSYGRVLSVGPDGTIYTFANTPYVLRALNPATGATLWSSTKTFSSLHGFPAAVDGASNRAYVVDGATLYGFDTTNGNVTTEAPLGTDATQGRAGPASVASPDTAYLVAYHPGSSKWKLLNVDLAGNSVRWSFDYGSPLSLFSAAPGVAVSTGVLYVHSAPSNANHFVHAIGDASYTTVAASSNSASMLASGIMLSTITVRVTGAGGTPVAGVPVTATSLSYSPEPVSLSPATNLVTYTNLLGEATFQHGIDLSSIFHVNWPSQSSTATFSVPGMSDVSMVSYYNQASTFTVTVTTGDIEDTGSIFRVSTITVTVTSSSGSRVGAYPVGIDAIDFPPGACGSIISPGGSYTLTNSTGQAQFVVKLPLAISQVQSQCPRPYQDFRARLTAHVLGLQPVTFDTRETRISTYTVSLTTAVLQSDVRQSTLTVTLYDVGGSTLPNVPVYLQNFEQLGSSGPFRVFFRGYYDSGVASANDDLLGYTDAYGQAKFLITHSWTSGSPGFDDLGDFDASFPVFPLNAAPSTAAVMVESNFLESYTVSVPTTVAVGIAFRSTVTAVNKYGHQLSAYNEAGVNLIPLFNNTAVQGTGALGTNQITFLNSGGQVVISSQTYNKIENIQIKAVRANQTKTGLSSAVDVTGPARFLISMPPAAIAGQVFIATISAVDVAGSTVVGYTGTLSLTSLLASNTAQLGTGQLSVTNVNMPANGWVTITNQSYNKGETIKLRAYDSALGIEGVSSTSIAVSLPALTISHYRVSVPTQVTVGVPFRAQFIALDASSSPVTYQLNRSLNIQTLLSLSPEISGTGSLGTSASSLAAGTNNTLITSQTYNKIQTVYIKVTDEDGRVGISTNAVVFSGPAQFDVTIATYAQAGVQFQMIVTARDGGGQQVLGYDGTVNVAAVQASNTALSGAGILGVTSLNVASGLGVSPFQTYTKAEGIRLRVTDSAINVTSYSSSMTVRAGPAASMTAGANPQSTVASVPSVLTATVLDQYSNPVQGSTVTYSVVAGSGVLSLSLSGGAVVSAVTTTNSVTDAAGQAGAFFGSTNTLSSQANLLRVSLGALIADTTIYNAVLISPAGGAIVNLADPRIRVDCPANAWSFSIRMSAQSRNELSAADLALTTAAFAAQSNVFVSTVVAKLSAVRDSNPNLSAGNSPTKVNLSLPVEIDVSSQVTVGSYRGQSLLVPLSVLRIFKLNQATSLFEMVLDGTNLADLSSRTVTAQLADPNGIYAIGAPPFTSLGSGSSGTVTAVLAAGATATVDVPFGAFAAATNLQVGVPSAASVPSLPANRNMTGTGLTISIQTTNSLQPIRPVSVTIGYRAQDVIGLNPDHLRLARYDEATGWVVLDSSVDTITRKVTGETDHFSLFQVVAVAPHADLSSGIVFPNPFRPNAGHTMLKFGQLPALAKIRIFTVSGRMLKQLETDATGQALGWDAKDKDGNALPSGVYLALVESGDSRKTLKFAIQR